MTNKEHERILRAAILLAGFFLGLAIGGLITSLRYDSEIRTDQLALKKDVAEIKADKATIKDIIRTLLFQDEQFKKERQELRELKLTLSMRRMK